jgi:hypothetical protein
MPLAEHPFLLSVLQSSSGDEPRSGVRTRFVDPLETFRFPLELGRRQGYDPVEVFAVVRLEGTSRGDDDAVILGEFWLKGCARRVERAEGFLDVLEHRYTVPFRVSERQCSVVRMCREPHFRIREAVRALEGRRVDFTPTWAVSSVDSLHTHTHTR